MNNYGSYNKVDWVRVRNGRSYSIATMNKLFREASDMDKLLNEADGSVQDLGISPRKPVAVVSVGKTSSKDKKKKSKPRTGRIRENITNLILALMTRKEE